MGDTVIGPTVKEKDSEIKIIIMIITIIMMIITIIMMIWKSQNRMVLQLKIVITLLGSLWETTYMEKATYAYV